MKKLFALFFLLVSSVAHADDAATLAAVTAMVNVTFNITYNGTSGATLHISYGQGFQMVAPNNDYGMWTEYMNAGFSPTTPVHTSFNIRSASMDVAIAPADYGKTYYVYGIVEDSRDNAGSSSAVRYSREYSVVIVDPNAPPPPTEPPPPAPGAPGTDGTGGSPGSGGAGGAGGTAGTSGSGGTGGTGGTGGQGGQGGQGGAGGAGGAGGQGGQGGVTSVAGVESRLDAVKGVLTDIKSSLGSGGSGSTFNDANIVNAINTGNTTLTAMKDALTTSTGAGNVDPIVVNNGIDPNVDYSGMRITQEKNPRQAVNQLRGKVMQLGQLRPRIEIPSTTDYTFTLPFPFLDHDLNFDLSQYAGTISVMRGFTKYLMAFGFFFACLNRIKGWFADAS